MVAVRTEDGGMPVEVSITRGAIEVPRQGEPGQGLQHDMLDRISIAFHLIEDPRMERGSGKHRPETERNQQLPADLLGPIAPGFGRLGGLKIGSLMVRADLVAPWIARRLERVDPSSNNSKRT